MTYKTGEIGPISGNDEFIVRNEINSVENPQGDWFKYMYVLNLCECEVGYDICNKKRTGQDYSVQLFEFIDHISKGLMNMKLDVHNDVYIMEKLKKVKFLNENGNFVIIDGDEKTVVGKLLDDEFLVQINGAWNEYLLPIVSEYRKAIEISEYIDRIGFEKYHELVKDKQKVDCSDVFKMIDDIL